MKKNIIAGVLSLSAFLSVFAGQSSAQNVPAPGRKIVMLVMQYPAPGLIKKAMAYAIQLSSAGIQSEVVLDGAAAMWAPALEKLPGGKSPRKNSPTIGVWTPNPENESEMYALYADFKKSGVPMLVSYSALDIFGWKEDVAKMDIPAAKLSPGGELDVVSIVKEGWEIWVF